MDSLMKDKRMRKFSSSTLDTIASLEECPLLTTWEMETVTSSHDSGFFNGSYSLLGSLPQLQEENGNFSMAKPDLLDCLVLEDLEERLMVLKRQGSSSSEVHYLENLLKLLDLQSQWNGEDIFGEEVALVEDSGRTGEGWGDRGVEPQGCSSFPTQVCSLNSFMEQEVPLAFPGQILPVASVSPEVPPPPRPRQPIQLQSDRKVAVQKSKPSQRSCGDEVLIRLGEATNQLKALILERKECEKMLVKRGISITCSTQRLRNSDIRLGKLLGDVREEHERISVMVKRAEKVISIGHSKTLSDSLATWQTIARNIANMVRSSQDGLALEILKMGKSMRRIRTILWIITSSQTL